ncbi:hypothetical protein [Candidatus Palauibacter sp.]|uniref:hypothetical protein n=1 Tax=Candidatus Palauibacter sp. TaxID=3101350 RepID=UPI003CC52593
MTGRGGMTGTDRPAFHAALVAVAELYGRTLSSVAQRMYWQALRRYRLADVEAAFGRHVEDPERGRFMPLPADVVAALGAAVGAPGPEEAWARAVAARPWDDETTVVIERAIFEAFPRSLWPDRVAARMAFLELYPAKLRRYGSEMWVSLGWDRAGRETALAEAVADGRIAPERALSLMPELEDRLPEVRSPDEPELIAPPPGAAMALEP